jgi:hypothetical protein
MYITAVAVPYGQVASDEVEEVGVHHRGPRRDEVGHELSVASSLA